MQALAPILQSKMDRLYHYLRPAVLKALPQLTLSQSLYDVLSRYFDDERLRLAFTFQAKYLGMSHGNVPVRFPFYLTWSMRTAFITSSAG
ncbi:zeta-carotene-forming phytoene desaturase [Anoxybacillus sp. BCO1]|nr:zeta-carotene-forming phytoene desaturase [Anoxybacillus sp. BCO1]